MILWKPSQSLCFSFLRHRFNNTGFWLRCFTAQWGGGGGGAESKLESNKSQIPKSGYICSTQRRSIKRGRGISLHFRTHHHRHHHHRVEHLQGDSKSLVNWRKKKPSRFDGEGMLQASRRAEKAQRGDQTLLDLFCGCQGEFRQIYREIPTVCRGRLWFDPRGAFTWGKGHKNMVREHSSNNITVHWSTPRLQLKYEMYRRQINSAQTCMHNDQRITGTWKKSYFYLGCKTHEFNASYKDVSLVLLRQHKSQSGLRESQESSHQVPSFQTANLWWPLSHTQDSTAPLCSDWNTAVIYALLRYSI